MHLGATLRLLRIETGFGLRDLARRLGVSSAYLSRVENGLDPVPTPDRLEAIAAALDVPVFLLLDAAHRLSPLAQRYVADEPQAAALLLDLARRGLAPDELEKVRRYIAREFPTPRGFDTTVVEPLASSLETRRVVLQLGGTDLRDVLDVACGRFARTEAGPTAAQLSAALLERCEAQSPAVGAGVAVPHLTVSGVVPQAAVITLAHPLSTPAPDGVKLSTFVVLVSGQRSREQLSRIAHVARLAARGLAAALENVRQPVIAIERIAALEHVR